MASFQQTNAHGHKKTTHIVPDTKVGEEGSAKRNIVRRKTPSAPGGSKKSSKPSNNIDDGSTYADSYALDENDPNYDSEEETGFEYIPSASPPRNGYLAELRLGIKAPMTLTEYKSSQYLSTHMNLSSEQ